MVSLLRLLTSHAAAFFLGAALIGTSRADEIDRFIAQEQRLYDLPAVVAGVIREGRLIDVRARGLVSIELGVKATADHVFEIGSISKQFTAYAILILRDEGKLDLDARLGRYLPELPESWGRVTLHRLLTHTSGLPDLEAAFSYDVYRETPSDADFLKRMLALPIAFEPGAEWNYSNTNYWLLARVIEATSGLSYSDFMQQRIFKPLQMNSTRSALPSQLLPNRSSGYKPVGGTLQNRDPIQPHTGRGLGDIATTIADMALWESEQLSPRLLSQSTADLARHPVILNDGKPVPYGYGWSTEPLLPVATLSHEGQTAGFTAFYVRVPDRKLAAVVLCNSFIGNTIPVALHLLRQVDPSLRLPPFESVSDIDPVATALARRVLSTAPSAEASWREEWFSPDYWRITRPWLRAIAESNGRFGRLMSLTPVAAAGASRDDTRTRVYRAVYESVTRIVTFRFDEGRRVSSRQGANE